MKHSDQKSVIESYYHHYIIEYQKRIKTKKHLRIDPNLLWTLYIFQLGYCECQEVDYSDYEETEEVDLVGLGIIDVRGLGGPLGKICKNGQGKR